MTNQTPATEAPTETLGKWRVASTSELSHESLAWLGIANPNKEHYFVVGHGRIAGCLFETAEHARKHLSLIAPN